MAIISIVIRRNVILEIRGGRADIDSIVSFDYIALNFKFWIETRGNAELI